MLQSPKISGAPLECSSAESCQTQTTFPSEIDCDHSGLPQEEASAFSSAGSLGPSTDAQSRLPASLCSTATAKHVDLPPGSSPLHFKEGFREQVVTRVLQSLLNHNPQPERNLILLCHWPTLVLAPQPQAKKPARNKEKKKEKKS